MVYFNYSQNWTYINKKNVYTISTTVDNFNFIAFFVNCFWALVDDI